VCLGKLQTVYINAELLNTEAEMSHLMLHGPILLLFTGRTNSTCALMAVTLLWSQHQLIHAKFHHHHCSVSHLWGEKFVN